MRFISPKTDFAFKKIFGSEQSKDILISFLNAIIYSEEDKIQDLEIIDPYNAASVVYLKDSYLDVKALLNDNTTVLIEMQVESVEAFHKRVIYNLSKTYTNQLESRGGYLRLNPVIALTITDFKMFKNTEKVITRFSFIERKEGFIYRDDEMEMVFVELPKFKKELEDLESITDKWIYFINRANSLEVIPETMEEVPALKKALEIAQRAQLSPKEAEQLHKQ
ncbi:MAG: Rpn family recombination-promoting nuclease/putative transposase, partial [Prochloron sp. SP5CPC1]|nr:Rpn family recombination-promoting nuclease/putative transposase [Candidatus Paraprochloron terpiosi SP5CPC1]